MDQNCQQTLSKSSDEVLTIPEIREKILLFANQVDAGQFTRTEIATSLRKLEKHLYRRKPKYKTARAKRKSLTPKLAREIRAFKEQNPRMSNREIGEIHGVDGGRVSEAIHNVKTWEKRKDK